MLALEGLSLHSVDGVPILSRLDLTVENGDWVAIMGPSGCGKSSLLEILVGFTVPTAGRVTFGERELKQFGCSTSIGYVPQDSLKLILPWRSILENIELVKSARGSDSEISPFSTSELLERSRLADRSRKFPLILSGGEQRRLALTMILAFCPSIILLDEPFTGVDLDLRFDLWNWLYDYRELRARSPTLLLITHSLEEAAVLCDYTVFLRRTAEGTIVHSVSSRRDNSPEKWSAKPSELYRNRSKLSGYLSELDQKFACAVS